MQGLVGLSRDHNTIMADGTLQSNGPLLIQGLY